MQTVADDMADSTNLAYGGFPDRLYLVGTDGTVWWQGDPGPRGFNPDALEQVLLGLPVLAAPAAPTEPAAPAEPTEPSEPAAPAEPSEGDGGVDAR